MITLPAGTYEPLYSSDPKRDVPAFRLDVCPVTNGEFLQFVRDNPAWRRSQVKRIFADDGYLSHWADDLEPGPKAPMDSPVSHVSWFAARAYAEALGLRLPTLAEWEYAAAVPAGSTTELARILAWYGKPSQEPLPPVRSTFATAHGVWDLHGLVWEWVEDFNTALVTGESRGDSALDQSLFCGGGAANAAEFRDYAAFMRYALRGSLAGAYTMANLGFRCAADVSREESTP